MTSSSSDSDDSKRKKKGFKISSSGTPVRWDEDNWNFYKQSMLNAFERSLVDKIALGTECEGSGTEAENNFKKKQAKVKMLIQGSLSMRLAKLVMSNKTGTAMWQEICNIFDGKTNPAMKAQKVYRLQGELHRTHLRANGDVRSHLYTMFEIKEQLKDLEAPVQDLQMVDMLLRNLPNQTCYNEPRRKVLFSKDMNKYTPDLVREMILTAESRSKDWDNHAFGNNVGKKTQGSASKSRKGGKQQHRGSETKKKTNMADVECFNCGGQGHYKRDCPDLLAEEKLSGRKDAQANYAHSGKELEAGPTMTGVPDCAHKRNVVVGEVVNSVSKEYEPGRWYFDSGTNVHISASKEYFSSLQSMNDSDWNPTISGFADGVVAQAEGFELFYSP